MAARYDLTIDAGATFTRTFTYRAADGTPISLTGYTATATFRVEHDDSTAQLTLTELDGLSLDGAGGTVTLTISDERTAALTFRRGVYDVLLTSPTGDRIRLVQGAVTVEPGVTR